MKRVNSHQTGFTLVELLIATTVFSIILLAAAAALIQVGRLYYKGVISSKTQGAARTVMDDISRSIQFNSGDVVSFPPDDGEALKTQIICVGTTRYTFVLNMQLNDNVPEGQYNTEAFPKQIRHVLWQDKVPSADSCQGPTDSGTPDLTLANPGGNGAEGKELVENGMRLTQLSASPQGNEVYVVNIGLIYGDNDLLLPNADTPETCKGSLVGGQWCAVSTLSTQVYKRVE